MSKIPLETSQAVNPQTGDFNLAWVLFFTKLITQTAVLNGAPCTVANLPASANNGEIRYATDCRVSGEAAGHGTGGLVTYCSSASKWRVAGTSVVASA